MIEITYTRDFSGNVCEFMAKGHAEYDEKGRDIVCAGVTAVFLAVSRTIKETLAHEDVSMIARDGYLYICFPQGSAGSVYNLLFKVLGECLILGCSEIIEMYGQKYVRIEEVRQLKGVEHDHYSNDPRS